MRIVDIARKTVASNYQTFPEYMRLSWAQGEAIDSLLNDLSEGDTRLFIDMPTGTGKTAVFLTLAEILNKFRNPDEAPVRFMVLCPTRPLVKHTIKEAQDWAPELSKNVGRLLYKNPVFDHSLLVTTYWTGTRLVQEGRLTDQCDAIILDESHFALSVNRLRAFGIMTPSIPKIAVTATPEFYVGKSMQSAGYKESYELGLKVSVQQGLLCGVRNGLLEFTDPELSVKDVKLNAQGEFDASDLDRVVNNQGVLKAIADFYARFNDPDTGKPLLGRSGFLNCTSIDHAIVAAETFNERLNHLLPEGVTACAAVWGNMDEKLLDKIIEGHQTGKIKFLASVDYLTQGYDHPPSSIAFNFRATTSAVVAGQRGGRVTRLDRANLDKTSLVFDIIYPDGEDSQVLYGDFAGFTSMFPHTQRFNNIANDNPTVTFEADENLLPFTIRYSNREVREYIDDRDMKKFWTGRKWATGLEQPILSALRRQQINRFEDFMEKVTLWALDHHYTGMEPEENDPRMWELKPKNIMALLKRTRLPYRQNEFGHSREFSFGAMVIAAVLKCEPKDLFGKLPEHLTLAEPFETSAAAAHHIFPNDLDFAVGYQEEVSISTDDIDEFMDRDHEAAIQILPESDPHAMLVQAQLKRETTKALAKLPPREERVLRQRFGIVNAGEHAHDDRTLDEIGVPFGVTRERIRQMEMKALNRLRAKAKNRSIQLQRFI